MCGIVGYVGSREAAPILVEGLTRLEYRGYDSAGVAVLNGRGVETRKVAGRITALGELLTRTPVHGACGIGHTRWATHGAPSERNAHPHVDCTGTVALVHNGIIENAELLRARLERAGHRFATETDTETLAHLIEDAPGATFEERVIAGLAPVEGTYGLAVISEADPGKIVVARRGSPLLIGVGAGEYLVASDANAVLQRTRSVVYLNDGDIAVLTPLGYRVLDRAARVQDRAVDDIEWDLETLALGHYPHFMLKEICEQPDSVRATLRGRLLPDGGTARLDGLNLPPARCARVQRIVILACGPRGPARARGLDGHPRLGGIRIRVPLPQAAPVAGDPHGRHLAVGGDGGHARGAAGREGRGLHGDRDRQRRRLDDRARGGWRHLPACRPGDRGRLHQGVHLAARRPAALRALPRAPARVGPGGGADAGARARASAGPGGAHPRARAGGARARRALRRRAQRTLPRTRRQLSRRPRRCAQAEGDLLRSCRGISCRRDEAWAHRAHRRQHAGRVRRAQGSRVREGRVQHARGEGAGRPRRRDHE